MSKQKKPNGKKKSSCKKLSKYEKVLLATAIINLLKAIIDLISKLTD